MKWFNIDQHISVIADIKHIFRDLGHEVNDLTLSGHASIMGRTVDNVPLLNGNEWCGTVGTKEGRQKFIDTYGKQLEQFDGFICCYPPLFAWLYMPLGKPIIVDIPIRFDYTTENNAEIHQEWCEALRAGVDRGQVLLVANNKLDKNYAENWIERPVEHIPSLCEYTGMEYDADAPKRPEVIYQSARRLPNSIVSIGNFVYKHDALPFGHPWSALMDFPAIAHIPYQSSTMSIFEQYTACIPMLFPSKVFLLKMYNENLVALREYVEAHRAGKKFRDESRLFPLDQVSFHTIFNRPPQSIRPQGRLLEELGDPNDYLDSRAVKNWWIDMADYYDSEWMPEIQYFSDWERFRDTALTMNYRAISDAMFCDRVNRKERVVDLWCNILKRAKQ